MNKNIAGILTGFWCLLTGLALAADPVVSNVRAVQRQGTPYVDITYDLADAGTNALFVSVAVSTNSGVSYFTADSGMSGQTGIVACGTSRAVVWNAGLTLPANLFNNVRVQVTASDTSAALAGDYMVIDLSSGTNAVNYPVSYLTAVPTGGWTDEYKTTKLVMRLIPAGVFTMGGRATDYPGASTFLHQVTLTKNFYIGVFHVTQRQWELVMGNRPSLFSNATYYASRPVEQVSYYEIRENPNNTDDPAVDWPNNSAVNASSFMGKLREKTGLTTFDLPTESQWEYACRSGTATALNSGYNLTNYVDVHMDDVGRYLFNNASSSFTENGDTTVGTAKVGSYLPNTWGLYDMHGNDTEWCLDWYGTYPGTVSDPKGAASGANRVRRGGGWGSDASHCSSAYRFYGNPGFKLNGNGGGFRVAKNLP